MPAGLKEQRARGYLHDGVSHLKGSILTAGGRLDSSGKTFVPSGAVEAFKKYLELAPDGPHANEVKQILDKTAVGN